MQWIDVKPTDWFYRDVIDGYRIRLDVDTDALVFASIPYNDFEDGKERIIRSYISNEDQIEFELPGYVPSLDNPVTCYVDGVPVPVETDVGKVYLPNPISAGLDVIIEAAGVPRLTLYGCHEIPTMNHNGIYPHIKLAHADNYVFDVNYSLNESAVTAKGQKLRRVLLDKPPFDSMDKVMHNEVGYGRNMFTIHKGILYTSFECWNIPITVEYNYRASNGKITHVSEKVIPTSEKVVWNDRYFPQVTETRYEYMLHLQRLRRSLYNRFTDRTFQTAITDTRQVRDVPTDKWYSDDLIDILNEKFLDGCYVFPLYEDDSFNPEGCITRAEAATFDHRFMEWALEKFR